MYVHQDIPLDGKAVLNRLVSGNRPPAHDVLGTATPAVVPTSDRPPVSSKKWYSFIIYECMTHPEARACFTNSREQPVANTLRCKVFLLCVCVFFRTQRIWYHTRSLEHLLVLVQTEAERRRREAGVKQSRAAHGKYTALQGVFTVFFFLEPSESGLILVLWNTY